MAEEEKLPEESNQKQQPEFERFPENVEQEGRD